MVSFTPNRKAQLWVVRDINGCYWLGTKSSTVGLDIVSDFAEDITFLSKPPSGSTVYLQVKLVNNTSKFVPILKRFSIKWLLLHKGKTVSIIIEFGSHDILCTLPSIKVEYNGIASLTSINLESSVKFKRHLFAPVRVPHMHLDAITREAFCAIMP